MKLVDQKSRGFISTFVGELYAILIGIGITSVIYDLKIELNSWLEIIMAIFVTIVITLYWWDWAAFVSSYFVASPAEFIIDFANLIVLEFLFVYYDDVQKLSATFFALGIIDFVWVTNYLLKSGEAISLRNGWILQKIMGIVIYGISLFIVITYTNTLSSVFLVSIVIATYILVRIFCFKGVKQEASINFKAANIQDIEAILEINHYYVNQKFNDKFLLQKFNDDNLLELINSNAKKVFVSTDKSEILAYVIVSYSIPPDLLDGIQWLDPSLAPKIKNSDCLYIDQIAVNPNFLGRKIGREFYKKLIDEQSAFSTICAFVALEPRCNLTSLRFHESLGFRKAALFNRDRFEGIDNYKSLLLVRR